ncbi:restriction endonuclease [Streptomyces sp. NPDC056402]|uniref:restriction endonuclease n=1 Tax=Streptomyces sp. NPDC056402 TaxID=3345810 RepID=UPI0035DB1031
MAPPGEDLDLAIGWDRFEKLILAVASRVLAFRGIKFRRYGVQGQSQHGIDLAGRDADGHFVVIQCKDYREFTATNLRSAVETFTSGKRPFNARHLIVATSAGTERTQLADELARLQDEHPDLELDLWGAEQINEFLRPQADVVARFWTRETADAFCTGAPLAGVPAPSADRQEQADRILIGPLMTSDVRPILRAADDERAKAPERSALKYGDLAARLEDAGFRGHATVLRQRQLDALREAGADDQAAELAAHIAAAALHVGDRNEPRRLARLLDTLARSEESAQLERVANVRRHARLIRAAVDAVLHPLGASWGAFADLLCTERLHPVAYHPLLVLLAAERQLAMGMNLPDIHRSLVDSAIAQTDQHARDDRDQDILMRLRLVRAEYDDAERRGLLGAARRRAVPGRHAALIKSREARRYCLAGRAEEAVDTWREAISYAISAGLTEEAADWLYAIRAVNVRYGPLIPEIDEEHRLAQALRATGAHRVRLLGRVRDPREQAMSSLVSEKPIEAVLSAQCWLADSVVTGSWAHEADAADFLGGLYANNAEAALAASLYARAGRTKKLVELAEAAGDCLLPVGPLHEGPWWVVHAWAALTAAQADLIPDEEVVGLLDDLITLAARGLAGELTDSPTQSLTIQAVKSACVLAARGTRAQAAAMIDLLTPEVPRPPGHHKPIDAEHATACVSIATAHADLAFAALARLFDLASCGVQEASRLLVEDTVGHLVGVASHRAVVGEAMSNALTDAQRSELASRAVDLVNGEHYLADVILAVFDPLHPAVRNAAAQARDRILQRPDPDPHRVEFGSRMVRDSFLVGLLDTRDQQRCLTKTLKIAEDSRESALNRKEALTAARNLVGELSQGERHEMFCVSKPFALGERDGSHLDGTLTGRPHPLGSFQFRGGSASLRGEGLYLAAAVAVTPEETRWVRDRALELVRSDDSSLVQAAAVTLGVIRREATEDIGVHLLATHQHVGVRQASAVLAARDLVRHRELAMRLAKDRDHGVRLILAQAVVGAPAQPADIRDAVLEVLRNDVNHSVRVAAALPSVSADV